MLRRLSPGRLRPGRVEAHLEPGPAPRRRDQPGPSPLGRGHLDDSGAAPHRRRSIPVLAGPPPTGVCTGTVRPGSSPLWRETLALLCRFVLRCAVYPLRARNTMCVHVALRVPASPASVWRAACGGFRYAWCRCLRSSRAAKACADRASRAAAHREDDGPLQVPGVAPAVTTTSSA